MSQTFSPDEPISVSAASKRTRPRKVRAVSLLRRAVYLRALTDAEVEAVFTALGSRKKPATSG